MSKPTDYNRDALDPVVARLWRAEVPDPQIAIEIGFSLRTVRRVRHRLRLLDRCTPAPHIEDSTLRALAAEGLTWAEIAERTGFTHRTVQERMSRLKCPAPNQIAPVLPTQTDDDDTAVEAVVARPRRLPLPTAMRDASDLAHAEVLEPETRALPSLADTPSDAATAPQP